MNPSDNFRCNKTIPFIGAGCLFGWLLATLIPAMTQDAAYGGSANAARGQFAQNTVRVENVVVSYTYQTSPNSTSGDNALAARLIEFNPNYVLVHAANGTTTLLATERLQQFSYRPADIK